MTLKRKIKAILRSLGYEFRKLPTRYDLLTNAFYDQAQLIPPETALTIFDLGAHVGETVDEYRRWFPNARIYSFEPMGTSFRALCDSARGTNLLEPFRLAMTDRTGHTLLYRYKSSAANSLLPVAAEARVHIRPVLFEEEQTEEVPTTTLDEFCSEHHVERVNILKMDIQGGEIMALRGARSLLSRGAIDLVYTEVLFAQLYEGQAQFCEIFQLMAEHGYKLFGLYNLNSGQNAVLAWGDAIFLGPALSASWAKTIHNAAASQP